MLAELEAYRRARVQVFLLSGQARAAELAYLVEVNLVSSRSKPRRDVHYRHRPGTGHRAHGVLPTMAWRFTPWPDGDATEGRDI